MPCAKPIYPSPFADMDHGMRDPSYLTHSFFVIIFPLHLFALRYLKPGIPVKQHMKNLRLVVADQVSGRSMLVEHDADVCGI